MPRWSASWRILDANLNRAREAARVAEDFARFAVDSAESARRLKEVRHRLRELAALLDAGAGRLLAARDTPGDVGTVLSTASEASRGSATEVAAAAFKRLQEALRVIEEYSKLECQAAAGSAEALRYEAYAVESALLGRAPRLGSARLCVIVSSRHCRGRDPADVAAAAVRGGAEMIQLREKEMDDRELLGLARRLRAVTAEAGALFIVNDRVHVAAAADADGVHLGPADLPLPAARRLLGAGAILGATTHRIEDARQAVADGADYIGVGPVFATATKPAEPVAGCEYVRAVAAEIHVPFFAIGGISAETIPAVVEAGASRVAVCSAVISTTDVEAAARRIRGLLPAAEGAEQG